MKKGRKCVRWGKTSKGKKRGRKVCKKFSGSRKKR